MRRRRSHTVPTRFVPVIVAAFLAAGGAPSAHAQSSTVFLHRLPVERLDVAPPTSRVRGAPGKFALDATACRPEPGAAVRRRIVDLAVQEWAFFGFAVMDETDPASWARPRGRPRDAGAGSGRGAGPGAGAEPGAAFEPGVFFGLGDAGSGGRGNASPTDPEQQARLARSIEEATRLAPSIAGYWAVTGDGPWIVERHNESWRASDGRVTRWRDAWSAAFISWVMCEAGYGDKAQFQRDVAHHVYVDQAIRARDGAAPGAVLTAFELGEQPIVPGDLVCLARRPSYRTLADRRAQMGEGARTHCDFVVKVDEERSLLLAIGGNVRGTVGLKLLPAERRNGGPLRPVDRSRVEGAATTFVHLKLDAPPIEANAIDGSPTLAAMACSLAVPEPVVAIAAAARRCEGS